jgi:hypothetical protein
METVATRGMEYSAERVLYLALELVTRNGNWVSAPGWGRRLGYVTCLQATWEHCRRKSTWRRSGSACQKRQRLLAACLAADRL